VLFQHTHANCRNTSAPAPSRPRLIRNSTGVFLDPAAAHTVGADVIVCQHLRSDPTPALARAWRRHECRRAGLAAIVVVLTTILSVAHGGAPRLGTWHGPHRRPATRRRATYTSDAKLDTLGSLPTP
jgi:hypothetical protein